MYMAPTSSANFAQAKQTLTDNKGTLDAASALDKARATRDKARIDAAAEDFEAVFIAEMLKPMFKGIEVDETFGGGKGEEIFSDMMVQEYGKMIAKQGGIGIAADVKAELIKMQGGSAPHQKQ